MKKYLNFILFLTVVYTFWSFTSPYFYSFFRSFRTLKYTEYELCSADRMTATDFLSTIKFSLQDKEGYKKFFNSSKVYSGAYWVSEASFAPTVGKSLLDSGFFPSSYRLSCKKQDTIKNIVVKIWYKTNQKKVLLAESTSNLIFGSFSFGNDTLWLPLAQITKYKCLEGIGLGLAHQFEFQTYLKEDKIVETNVYLRQTFSTENNGLIYYTRAGLYGGNRINVSLMHFIVSSKDGKYTIYQTKHHKEIPSQDRFRYTKDEASGLGLKNLDLDFFQTGTIEVELTDITD